MLPQIYFIPSVSNSITILSCCF